MFCCCRQIIRRNDKTLTEKMYSYKLIDKTNMQVKLVLMALSSSLIQSVSKRKHIIGSFTD